MRHEINEVKHLRKKTDQSLQGEREKADEYLDKKGKKIVQEAESTIQTIRKSLDNKREEQQATSNHSESAEKAVAKEREKNGKALHQERARVDQALEKERLLTQQVTEDMLDSQRKQTDTNLSEERTGVDTNSDTKSALLSDEKSSHEATKTELLTRDQFLAVVSHDLKSPLSSITMSVGLLRDELSKHKDADEGASEFLEIIERNAHNMYKMITDLLDVERMTNNKLILDLKPNKIVDLFEECKSLFGPLALSNDLTLTFDQSDENLSGVFDRDRILQVLSNLITNAAKFTPSPGFIKVSVQEKNSELEFSVSDSGPGISDDKKQEIFERYYQLNSRDRSGLGLGLYIAKWIVDAHKGKVWVTSEPGQGSTFFFTLPALEKT